MTPNLSEPRSASLRDCKTVDEVLAASAKFMDECFEQKLDEFIESMVDLNMDPGDLAVIAARQRREYQAFRAQQLDTLRAWLKRSGETLN